MKQLFFLATLLVYLQMTACSEALEAGQASEAVPVSNVSVKEPADLVWPWLDSANSRWFFFNSATRPFGMVNLSPDTELEGAWGSGYRYETEHVKVLSHVHAWQLSGLPLLPVSTESTFPEIRKNYGSPFSHETEIVKPGYHRLWLERYGIEVELTATTRAGFHRYHFGDGKPRQVLIPLQGKLGPGAIGAASIRQVGPRELEGHMVNEPTVRRPRRASLYFVLRFNADISGLDSWEGEEFAKNVREVAGDGIGGLVHFADGAQPLMMQVGLSWVDIAGARGNLETELPHWDFDRIVSESRDVWNQWLSSIEVEGGTQEQRIRFYTDLFHALQGRRIISDVDGRYTDNTSERSVIKQLPLDDEGRPLYQHYNFDAFWGAQWTIQTLWPLAYPRVASEFASSMMTYYHDGGLIPRGPSGGNYTYVMTGASTTPFFVSNWMKGIRDLDIEDVYTALKKNHMPGGIMQRGGYEHHTQLGGGFSHYLEKGYAPYPLPEEANAFHKDGAGQTLEYAFQDWTLAQLAADLGKQEDAAYFTQRSQNYRKLFDPATGFIRPRNLAGDWHEPFDPYRYKNGFVESNAAQGTWYVPHDYTGLAELMGGADVLVSRLDEAFRAARELGFTAGKSHDKETREKSRRIPINYGNQPSMQTAFIFNVVGAPWLTQKWSREVINAVYTDVSPNAGYNGDEDQGLMGSLAVLMKIGLFQLDGGTTSDPIYQIGSPVFDRITIRTDPDYYSGESFVIDVTNNSDKNRYIQSMSLNGRPLDRFFLYHREIVAGGKLELEMGPDPVIPAR